MTAALDDYLPFDAGVGANVTEARWRSMMKSVLPSSGVLSRERDRFEVYANSSGMSVRVESGECWMRGHWGESTSEKTLTITAAHATLARIDRVVLRLDTVNNLIQLAVLDGTPAASPTAPAVTQSATTWETSLATVSVPAADTTIDAAQVTDARTYADVATGSGVVTLTDAATIALDASLGRLYRVTTTGNRTVGVPTNLVDGVGFVIAHRASGGARTLSLTTGSAGAFAFGTDVTGLTATSSGTVDYIGCIYEGGSVQRVHVIAYTKGF